MADSLRLLIVDDNPLDAELLAHAVRRAGFEPDWRVTDTAEGVVAALATAPEVVFSDYNMGQFDAAEVLNLMRGHRCSAPLIVVSGSADDTIVTRLLQQGAAGFLLKDQLAEVGTLLRQVLAPRRPVE